MNYYIGIDLGGTNIVAGLVDEGGKILARESVRTNAPRRAEDICDDIAALCAKLMDANSLKAGDIQWVGMGSPGLIFGNTVVFANNLDFHNVPLGTILQRKTGIRTLLQNDGNAAAYGELLVGAGKGHSSLVGITLGTGVGGGIVVGNRIHNGFNGAAGELGHLVIMAGGRECTCGNRGCLEAYCSATAIKRITREAMEQNRDSLLWELCGGSGGTVSAKACFQAQRAGDETGAWIVEDFLQHLAVGVSNMINLLQPEVICIGGGMSKEGDAILLPLREKVETLTYPWLAEQRSKIVLSKLDSDAGLIGAALLGRQTE